MFKRILAWSAIIGLGVLFLAQLCDYKQEKPNKVDEE